LRFQQAATVWITIASFTQVLLVAAPSPLLHAFWRPTLIREVREARRTIAVFLNALTEIRMLGNPGPRAVAEDIAALMGELYETDSRHRLAQQSMTSCRVTILGRCRPQPQSFGNACPPTVERGGARLGG
jgi:hypothetical protein